MLIGSGNKGKDSWGWSAGGDWQVIGPNGKAVRRNDASTWIQVGANGEITFSAKGSKSQFLSGWARWKVNGKEIHGVSCLGLEVKHGRGNSYPGVPKRVSLQRDKRRGFNVQLERLPANKQWKDIQVYQIMVVGGGNRGRDHWGWSPSWPGNWHVFTNYQEHRAVDRDDTSSWLSVSEGGHLAFFIDDSRSDYIAGWVRWKVRGEETHGTSSFGVPSAEGILASDLPAKRGLQRTSKPADVSLRHPEGVAGLTDDSCMLEAKFDVEVDVYCENEQGGKGRPIFSDWMDRNESRRISGCDDRIRYDYRYNSNDPFEGNIGAWCHHGDTVRVP